MAVVVQALVPARASAVAFTADPLTGAGDAVVVHAIRGLGPGLVDNAVTPDVAIVDKADLTVRSYEAGDKHLRLDARPGGGVVRRRQADAAPALTDAELVELADAGARGRAPPRAARRHRGRARRPLGAAASPPDHDPGRGMTTARDTPRRAARRRPLRADSSRTWRAARCPPATRPPARHDRARRPPSRNAPGPALVWSGGELSYGELFALAAVRRRSSTIVTRPWPWSARSPCVRSRARWAACSAAGPSCCRRPSSRTRPSSA